MDRFNWVIFGGSFDPIHYGHLHIIQALLQLDPGLLVRITPAYHSPLKAIPQATSNDRLHMIELAIQDLPRTIIDHQELARQKPSYTLTTLQTLSRVHSAPLNLTIGADAFNQFDRWHNWLQILDLANLIVVDRPANNLPIPPQLPDSLNLTPREITNHLRLKAKPGQIYRLKINPPTISSSTIRELIRRGKKIHHLVPNNVAQYINDNLLYKD